MAVTYSDWAVSNPLGPNAYAPPDRRAPEEPTNGARVAVLRPQTVDRSQSNEASTGSIDALIRRLAGNSLDEIDNVMRELEHMRQILRNEGERISHEIAGYASLSQASASAMRIISDSLEVWKDKQR